MVLITKKYFGLQQFLLFIIIHDFITVMGRTLKDFPEECFTANEIDDDTRAFENLKVPTSKADDLDLKKGWYRIMGKSANSLKQGFDRIVVRQNAPNFCGTVYAGTLMGEHPTVDEGMVEMTVCFRKRFCFNSNIDQCECKSKKTVYVRNCFNHFIYWLSPTNVQERYCTGRTTLTGVSVKDGSSDAVECRQHKKYDSPSRIWNKVSDVTCDEESGWYRFSNDAGGEMSSQCSVNIEPISRLAQPCGAAFRGWMVDRHPTLSEGRLNSRICFSYHDSCSCEFYANIAVRNCGSFFVYLIRAPPLCNGKYCGAANGSSAAANDVVKPPNKKKTNICHRYDVLHDPSRLWSFTSPTESNCDARLYGYFRFGSKYTHWSVKEGCNKSDMNTVTHRCGTFYQGYMEFRHPTVNEGFVERIICFQDAKVPCECHFTTIIGVQNCSGFYVYELRGVPKCQARMCMVANGSDTIKIDRDRPPVYGIPVPGYTIAEKPKLMSEGNGDDAVVTTTILCIIILIVLIVIVIIILTVLYIAHPVIWPSRDKEEKAHENNIPEVRKELLVESCMSHENETEEEVSDPMDHQYRLVPDPPPDEQEHDIIKRSDLVPDTPPEERNDLKSPDVQEDDIQKRPDSEEEIEEKATNSPDEAMRSAESIELGKIEDDIDDIMHDLDVTRSDIVNLMAGDTSV